MTAKLTYRPNDQMYPIPPAEKDLPTITAEKFVDVNQSLEDPPSNVLEGLDFDQNDQLYFVAPARGDVFRVDMKNQTVKKFVHLPDHMFPGSLKVHADGRLFVPCVGSDNGSLVAALDPESGEVMKTTATGTKHKFDDMCFDKQGGFYLSDLIGDSANPNAGIFYVEPDEKTMRPFMGTGLIGTNGIDLDPQENCLWVTEYGRNRLLHYSVVDTVAGIPPYNAPYKFTGLGWQSLGGPDSISIDHDGNVYVAMFGQGRYLIFNKNGFPIGQILLPGREQGDMLASSHLAIRPGTKEAYMCGANLKTGKAAIFKAEVYATSKEFYQGD